MSFWIFLEKVTGKVYGPRRNCRLNLLLTSAWNDLFKSIHLTNRFSGANWMEFPLHFVCPSAKPVSAVRTCW